MCVRAGSVTSVENCLYQAWFMKIKIIVLVLFL